MFCLRVLRSPQIPFAFQRHESPTARLVARRRRCGRSLHLAITVLILGGLTGCFIPVSPGCEGGANFPYDDRFFLFVRLASDSKRGASIGIDHAGRSRLVADHTVWLLGSRTSCQAIPSQDLVRLEEAWKKLVPQPVPQRSPRPSYPYLQISYYGKDGEPRRTPDFQVFIEPEGGRQSSDLKDAARITLDVLVRVYGSRFRQELRASGLEDLLREAV